MGSLLDETVTWAEFGRLNLDRRITKAITDTLGLERPTLVQSQGIPVALKGKDLLCRARTGSGKTLCYAVPLVQRLLADATAGGGSVGPMRGLILVPTKELVSQVHNVITTLLSFAFDVLTAEPLLSGQKYMKTELPAILVTTPSSVLALVKQRQGTMQPLSETLKILVVDEADLMFSFGYEADMQSICVLMPSTYQAMLVSATLSEEVEQLKGLMLHKPVVLKLEEPRVTGKLTQFYMVMHKEDKHLILYALLKLQLIQGKTLLFVKSVDAGYRLKILLERFSINTAVLNDELPHASRQNIIQAFNQGVVELLIATDKGCAAHLEDEDAELDEEEEDESSENMSDCGKEEDIPEESASAPKKKLKSGVNADSAKGSAETTAKKRKKKKKAKQSAAVKGEADEAQGEDKLDESEDKSGDEEEQEDEDDKKDGDGTTCTRVDLRQQLEVDAPNQRRLGRRMRAAGDGEQYSLTRGVDLHGVSTVVNADMPTTVRDYVHRVGRCARGGASGTALTLCTQEEQPMLEKIVAHQASSGSTLKKLPMHVSDAERFRYRVEDMAKGLTKKAVARYRARELQLEALRSEKLKEYFDEHPEEKKALQRSQRQIRERKSVRRHLEFLPGYLVPEQFVAATPVQKAVREEAAAHGGSIGGSMRKRKKAMRAKAKDPLQAFHVTGKQRLRARMEAKDKTLNPKSTNVEDLPPLSGRKLWKIRHKKKLMKPADVFGERKNLTLRERKRKNKFDV